MQIPNSFKQAIAETFYDKEVEIWSSIMITDDEGSTVQNTKKDLIEIIKGNFQFKTREKIQQEYGQEVKANAIVTCANTKAVESNILVYNTQEYEISSVLTYDSHITLLVNGSDETG